MWFNMLVLMEKNGLYQPWEYTQSCGSLAELDKSTIEKLSASTGYKYPAKDIVEKINFVII